MKDGETVVIGGLRRIDFSTTYEKIPFLGDIPLLGTFFRKKDAHEEDTELLIFVTPHIVKDAKMSLAEREKFIKATPPPHKGVNTVNYLEERFGLKQPRQFDLRPPQ